MRAGGWYNDLGERNLHRFPLRKSDADEHLISRCIGVESYIFRVFDFVSSITVLLCYCGHQKTLSEFAPSGVPHRPTQAMTPDSVLHFVEMSGTKSRCVTAEEPMEIPSLTARVSRVTLRYYGEPVLVLAIDELVSPHGCIGPRREDTVRCSRVRRIAVGGWRR